MKNIVKAVSVVSIMGLLTGCVGSIPDDAAKLGVFFTFTQKHRCSDISPQIRVGGAPENAAKYRVKMVDLNAPKIAHGGGTVEAKGAIISEGALDKYKGPCARDGSHVYNIQVIALDSRGKVIGAGENSERF
jgi:phosphatidylethanolamine-binding protein (PEBP) family uncharacterized protein